MLRLANLLEKRRHFLLASFYLVFDFLATFDNGGLGAATSSTTARLGDCCRSNRANESTAASATTAPTTSSTAAATGSSTSTASSNSGVVSRGVKFFRRNRDVLGRCFILSIKFGAILEVALWRIFEFSLINAKLFVHKILGINIRVFVLQFK
ncbi:hypothetical protein HAV15_012338 [Penicillium sp. str. |nr:hypothetical protein HAV15_012338 [Penicillium sp. str. \